MRNACWKEHTACRDSRSCKLCIAKSVFDHGMKNLPRRVITGPYRLHFAGRAAVKRMVYQVSSHVIERNVDPTCWAYCPNIPDHRRWHGETDRQQYSVSSGGSVSGGIQQFNDGIARPDVNYFIRGFASKFLATNLFTFHIVFVILTNLYFLDYLVRQFIMNWWVRLFDPQFFFKFISF